MSSVWIAIYIAKTVEGKNRGILQIRGVLQPQGKQKGIYS